VSKSVKYILVAVAVLFVLLLIPSLIPLSKYKDLIKDQVQQAVGRELTIDGDISLSILPRPKIKIDGIKLSSLAGATKPYLLELKSAEAAVAILPLLTGNIVVSYVELKEPKVILEKLKDGRATWEFEKTVKNEVTALEGNVKSTKSNELPLNIGRIIVSKGELTYIDGADSKSVEDLDLDVKLESIKGPIDFDLVCKIMNQDISLNGTIKEIGDIIPLVAELKTQGEKIKLSGDVNVNDSSFKGEISSEGNLKNSKFISTNDLPAGLKEDYKFSAEINADKTKFASNNISFKMGDVTASGQAKYMVESATGALDLVLQPGKIALNCSPKDSADGYIINKVQLQAGTIKPFLEALKIDTKELPEFLSQTFSIVADLKYKDQDFSIQNIDFNLGEASMQGMVGAKNWTNALVIPYDIRVKNGNALANLVGTSLPVNLRDIHIKGELSKNDKIVKTDTTISVAKTDVNIKGTMDIDKEIKSDFAINVKGNSLDQTIVGLTQKSSNKRLGSFNINSTIKGNFKKNLKVALQKSSILLGSETLDLNGTGDLKFDGAKPNILFNLAVSSLNLNMLADNSSNSPARANSPPAATSSSGSHWTREKINFAFLHSFDGDLNLTIAKIASGALIFDNFKTKLAINNGVLNVASLTGNLYGGKLEGAGSVVAKKDGSADINLKATLSGAQLRNIVPTQGKIKVTQGIIDFNADVKTKGDSQYSYVDNLSGTVTLNSRDGRLSGLDLQKIVRTLNEAKNLQNILKSLDNSFLQGETDFKTIENKISIDRGIANLVVSKVIANGGEANALGTVNLPKYSLDIDANIKVDIKNMPPFKAHLYGALDNPQYKLDMRALQQYLVNNVLTNVMDSIKSGKTRPEDILKGILGGGKSKEQAPAEENQPAERDDSNPSPKNEVNELISKGLKGLFK